MSEIFYVRDFLSALMLATSLVNSGQKISNIGPCPNCPADTVPDMDFRTSRVRQKSPGQRPCTTLLAGDSQRVIAKHFGISKTSVYRVIRHFRKFGSVEPLFSLCGRPR